MAYPTPEKINQVIRKLGRFYSATKNVNKASYILHMYTMLYLGGVSNSLPPIISLFDVLDSSCRELQATITSVLFEPIPLPPFRPYSDNVNGSLI